jgi:hypothetical protein
MVESSDERMDVEVTERSIELPIDLDKLAYVQQSGLIPEQIIFEDLRSQENDAFRLD